MRSAKAVPRDDDSAPMAVSFTLRLDPQLRDEFVSLCAQNDMTAAQMMRKMMRDYIAEHDDPKSRSAEK